MLSPSSFRPLRTPTVTSHLLSRSNRYGFNGKYQTRARDSTNTLLSLFCSTHRLPASPPLLRIPLKNKASLIIPSKHIFSLLKPPPTYSHLFFCSQYNNRSFSSIHKYSSIKSKRHSILNELDSEALDVMLINNVNYLYDKKITQNPHKENRKKRRTLATEPLTKLVNNSKVSHNKSHASATPKSQFYSTYVDLINKLKKDEDLIKNKKNKIEENFDIPFESGLDKSSIPEGTDWSEFEFNIKSPKPKPISDSLLNKYYFKLNDFDPTQSSANFDEKVSREEIEAQITLEHKAVSTAVERYRRLTAKAYDRNQAAAIGPSRSLVVAWFSDVVDVIKQAKASIRKTGKIDWKSLKFPTAKSKDDIKNKPYVYIDDVDYKDLNETTNETIYGHVGRSTPISRKKTTSGNEKRLLLLSSEKLAVIVIHQVLSQTLNGGNVALARLAFDVGNSIKTEYNIEIIQKTPGAKKKLDSSISGVKNAIKINSFAKYTLNAEEWPKDVMVDLGASLIELLIKSTLVHKKPSIILNDEIDLINSSQDFSSSEFDVSITSQKASISPEETDCDNSMEAFPAFQHKLVYRQDGTGVGVICASPELVKLVEKRHANLEIMNPRQLPMVTKPIPWDHKTGGYLTQSSYFMRIKSGSRMQSDVLEYANINQVYDAINVLNAQDWSINKDILDVVEYVWANGGDLCAIPSRLNKPLPVAPTYEEEIASITEEKKKLGLENRHYLIFSEDDKAGKNKSNKHRNQLSEFADVSKKAIDNFRKEITQNLDAKVNNDSDAIVSDSFSKETEQKTLKQQISSAKTKKMVKKKFLLYSPAHRRYVKQLRKIQQENRDLHSLRCDLQYKLQVAREFKDKKMYFPHNIDFRGRAYPIPPHLNHMGADICRGLLNFGEAKPVGKMGIFWIKIQLANLCGKDKGSFERRVKFVEDNKEYIMDSANRPNDGFMWWAEQEEPWQVLANCIELTNIWQFDGNPEEYLSKLPIQMDGSCNGLQHYAALGRDEIGALHVNLLPSEQPKDVYLGVRDVVLKHIDKDAENGNKWAKLLQPITIQKRNPKTGEWESQLVDVVERYTIKQTVMTSVYGVTVVGARLQIFKKLKEKKLVADENLYGCAIYLAKVTLKSLGEVFEGANNTMEWLNQCASVVASKQMPVMWITPYGIKISRNSLIFNTIRFASDSALQSSNQRENCRYGFTEN